ncbi:MAG: SCP2 sterol-binding domain-containing protein [Oscillospiraceae bacterium]|nr:SCP2 sterol-binding domain-containing protein [Oscillospiraceae bacterium]
MTYKEIVEKVKKEFGKADVSNYEDHLALQINITGEGEGSFYTEINEGKLIIEPYDYNDNNATLTASADDIIKIFGGKLDMNEAAESGKLEIAGDYAKALSIQPVIEGLKKPARKTAAKKTTTKKAAEKETTAKKKTATKKTAEKAEAKTVTKAVKETAKKTTAAKTTAAKSTRTAKKG